jgi:hypothetical protein
LSRTRFLRRGSLRITAGALAVALTTSAAEPPPRPTPETEPAPATSPAPVALPTAAPVRTRVERRLGAQQLQLPGYARGTDDPFAAAGLPAFHEEIEVLGRPRDRQALTAKMRWWMTDFEPVYAGAAPTGFHAPTLLEMSEHRPMPPRAADFTPLLGWLLGKVMKKDGGSSK